LGGDDPLEDLVRLAADPDLLRDEVDRAAVGRHRERQREAAGAELAPRLVDQPVEGAVAAVGDPVADVAGEELLDRRADLVDGARLLHHAEIAHDVLKLTRAVAARAVLLRVRVRDDPDLDGSGPGHRRSIIRAASDARQGARGNPRYRSILLSSAREDSYHR